MCHSHFFFFMHQISNSFDYILKMFNGYKFSLHLFCIIQINIESLHAPNSKIVGKLHLSWWQIQHVMRNMFEFNSEEIIIIGKCIMK